MTGFVFGLSCALTLNVIPTNDQNDKTAFKTRYHSTNYFILFFTNSAVDAGIEAVLRRRDMFKLYFLAVLLKLNGGLILEATVAF